MNRDRPGSTISAEVRWPRLPGEPPCQRTAMATPHRNDPCPCGSGRRFKECCLSTRRLRGRRSGPPVEQPGLAPAAGAGKDEETKGSTEEPSRSGPSERQIEQARFYDAGIDEPHRSLGGMTPRKAAAHPRAWRKLEVVLNVKEHAERELPEEARYDFAALRLKLGMTKK